MSVTPTAPPHTVPATVPLVPGGDVRPAVEGHGLLPSGPWLHAFWVAIPGAVRSKANHRQDRRSKGTWAQNSGYELEVNCAVRDARPHGWHPGTGLRLPDRPKVLVVMAARTLLDAGNISKSFLDACQNTLYVTDAQVAAQAEVVTRTGEDGGMRAAFAQLPATATAGQCAAALIELMAQTSAVFYEGVTPAGAHPDADDTPDVS